MNKRIPNIVVILIALAVGGSTVRSATVNWTNTTSGFWNTAANWNPNSVPGATDTAIITNAGVTVSLNGATTVGGIILGTNGAGTVTLLLAGQSVALNGPLTVNPSGSFTVDGGSLVGNTNAVLSGTIGWTAGSLGGILTLASGSTLNISTASNNHIIGGCILTNNGTVNWSGDTLYAGGGTVFHNYGLWNAQDDHTLNNYYGGAGTVFNNYGTFRKSGGTNSSYTLLGNPVTFNSTGIVDVQQGLLVLQGGGKFTGGYVTTNSTGATYLSIGSFNLNGTVTGTNMIENAGDLVGTNVIQGALTWQSGSWNNTVVTVSSNSMLNLNTASVNHTIGGCLLTNYGTVNWSDDTLYAGGGAAFYNYGLWNAQDDHTLNNFYGGAGTVFNNFGTFRKSAGNNASYTMIGNPVTFNNTGIVDVQQGVLYFQGTGNFTGGYITTNSTGTTYFSSGNFNVNGTVTGTNVIENAGLLVGTNVIHGVLTWQSGAWNGAVVTVSSNSVLNISTASGNHTLGGCLLTNFGTVNWSGDTLWAGGGAVIYNYGLWNAQDDHTLNNFYGAAGTVFNNFGSFRKSAGNNASYTLIGNPVTFNNTGIVDVQHGVLYFQGTGNFTGGYLNTNSAGTTYLSSGNFTINGTVTGNNVIENPGILVGTNVIHGALIWQSGAWNGAVVTVSSNSVLTISTASGNHTIGGCLLTNYGTVNWSGDTLYAGGGAAFYNYGLWNAQDDHPLNNYYGGDGTVFNNFGTFRKSAGTATAIAVGVTFINFGTLDAQFGNIALQGAYTLANGTKMGFGLGGWLGNGSISLSGAASFSGSLSVNINGYFWPVVGSSFNLLNYTSESGVLFTNTVLAAPFTWQTNYNATAFAVTVVARPAFTNTVSTNLFGSVLNPTTLYLAWPGDHTGWSLQAQTNSLGVGLTPNWATVPGSSVTNEFFMPIVKTNSTVFYRMIYP